MPIDFTGKTVIVTGAARGIGYAIAGRFCEYGAASVIADIDIDRAETAAGLLRARGYAAEALYADVTNIESMKALSDTVEQRHGKIDCLVNNAGIAEQIGLFDLEPDQFDRLLSVNLRSVVFLSKYVMQAMRRRDSGSIVNIASIAGERGGKFAGIHYTASKGGIIAATKALAMTGSDFGVRVNAVAPGLIATEMSAGLNFGLDGVLLKRLGTTDEVADGVVFLCSDMASYITGMTLDVNGGLLMR